MKFNLPQKQGFSLIEVLVFVSILSVFFVTAISVSVSSFKNLQYNEHKIIASKYAQDVVEWTRSEKETDWGGRLNAGGNTFTEKVTQQGNAGNLYQTTFCFNTSPIVAWPGTGACASTSFIPFNTGFSAGYTRQVVFTSTVASGFVTTVNMQVTVQWYENGVTNQVPVNTLFTIYE